MSTIQTSLVTIGVDPHPTTHTAVALDWSGRVFGSLTVSHSEMGLQRLRTWAEAFEERQWAIEGIGNAYIHPFVTAALERLKEATIYRNDLPRNLHQIIETYLRFATSQTNFYRLLTSCYLAPPDSDLYRVARPVHEKQHALVEAMFEHASFDHGNMRGRARRYAHSFIGLVNTYLMLVLAGEVEVDDQLKHDIVQQFSYGIYT